MMTLRQALDCTSKTQEDLARYFDVHKNTVNNWVAERTDVGIKQYQEILRYLSEHITESDVIPQIECLLRDDEYVLSDTNIRNPRLEKITSYEIAERYVYAGLDPIRDDFCDGTLGKIDKFLEVVAAGIEYENDHMGSVQIAPIGGLNLTTRNVIEDLNIGNVNTLLDSHPTLFASAEDIQDALDKESHTTQEQRDAIVAYLQTQHPLLAHQEFDF